MTARIPRGEAAPVLFILGRDYHLGDLLGLTPVLAQYRRIRAPGMLMVALPDRDISRILEHNPDIDRLIYGDPREIMTQGSQLGVNGPVYDLRVGPIAAGMVRDWRHHWPWLYYRDLWAEPRGQWLATYLHLGRLTEFRPRLKLVDEDRPEMIRLNEPYVVLAPRIGSYALPLTGRIWRTIKGWDDPKWEEIGRRLRRDGFETVTVTAGSQGPVAGTRHLSGLPIRQAAAAIAGAQALITGESGLWFVAAALGIPFIIVPWWLPSSMDWAAPMGVPYSLIPRRTATVDAVFAEFRKLAVDRPFR